MGMVNNVAGPAMDMMSARRVMAQQPSPSGLVAQPAPDPQGGMGQQMRQMDMPSPGQGQLMNAGPNSIQSQPQAGVGMARMMGGQAPQMGQYGQMGQRGQMGGFGMQQPMRPQFGGGFMGGMYQPRPQMFGGGGFGMNPFGGMGMQGMGMRGMGMGMGGMGGYGMSPMMSRGFGMGMGGMQNPYGMMGQQPMMRQQQGFMGGMYNQGMNAARQMPQARMGQMMNAPMDTSMAQQRGMAQQGLGQANQNAQANAMSMDMARRALGGF